jgi:ceramide glucosyltransferase
VIAAAFAAPAFGLSPLLGALMVLLPWYAGEIVLSVAVGWFVSWRTPIALLVRDIAFPGIWAYAFVGGDVSWRGNAMKIRIDGENALNDAVPAVTNKVARDGG